MSNVIPLRPESRDLIGHRHEAKDNGQSTQHIVHFDYPDCTRSFDGDHWKMTPKVKVPMSQVIDTPIAISSWVSK